MTLSVSLLILLVLVLASSYITSFNLLYNIIILTLNSLLRQCNSHILNWFTLYITETFPLNFSFKLNKSIILIIYRPVFITTVQTNLHNDFITYLKSIEKRRSMIRIMERCSNGKHNKSNICHGNSTYNYVDILSVSICFI